MMVRISSEIPSFFHVFQVLYQADGIDDGSQGVGLATVLGFNHVPCRQGRFPEFLGCDPNKVTSFET
jgi:hypothetical protein